MATSRIFPARSLLWLWVWAGLAVFVIWPVGEVLLQSFLRNGAWDPGIWRNLFVAQTPLLMNSLGVAASVAVCTVAIAFFVALHLVYGRSLRRVTGAVILLSMISPPFVSSMAFIMLFGRRGLITWKLLGLDWDPYGMHGIVLMQTFSLVGLAALLIAISLRGLDHGLERASLDLGASPAQTLLRVSLPLARPGIFAATLIIFVRALSDFATPLFVGGSFQVLAARAYTVLINMGDFQLSCAMNVLLLLPALLSFWLARRLSSGQVFSLGLADADERLLKLPPLPGACAVLACVIFVAAQLLLYGLIVIGALTTTWGLDFTPTLTHLDALLDFRQGSILRSLGCATLAALGSAFLGMLGAWLLRGSKGLLSRFAGFAMEVPYMLPGTFFGLGYLLAFSRLPFEVSATALIALNFMYRQLSPALRAGIAGISSINPQTENAARDLGASPWVAFRDVTLPMLRPSAVFAFISAFAADIVSTGPIIFLVTPYAKVMSVDMFEAITAGDFGAANSMALAIIVIVLAVNGLALLVQRERKSHA